MRFVCTICNYDGPKRFDLCPKCDNPNTCRREQNASEGKKILRLSEVEPDSDDRTTTGRADWDAALNGGIVRNMVILVPGKPGFGKTSEMLRVGNGLGTKRHPVALGVSERSSGALALRCRIVGCDGDRFAPSRVFSSGEFVDHVEEIGAKHAILDSWGGFRRSRDVDDIERLRKTIEDGSLWIICHVTKSGDLAGESELAHLVDAVVWVRRRTLYTSKNWHGPNALVTDRLVRPAGRPQLAKAQPKHPQPPGSSGRAPLRVVR